MNTPNQTRVQPVAAHTPGLAMAVASQVYGDDWSPKGELPHRVKFSGNLLVSADESLVIGTFHNVKGRADYRQAILDAINGRNVK